MLHSALWFSEEKPSMTTLLRPLMDEIFKNGNCTLYMYTMYMHLWCVLTQYMLGLYIHVITGLYVVYVFRTLHQYCIHSDPLSS